jgi:hypothetical protein
VFDCPLINPIVKSTKPPRNNSAPYPHLTRRSRLCRNSDRLTVFTDYWMSVLNASLSYFLVWILLRGKLGESSQAIRPTTTALVVKNLLLPTEPFIVAGFWHVARAFLVSDTILTSTMLEGGKPGAILLAGFGPIRALIGGVLSPLEESQKSNMHSSTFRPQSRQFNSNVIRRRF